MFKLVSEVLVALGADKRRAKRNFSRGECVERYPRGGLSPDDTKSKRYLSYAHNFIQFYVTYNNFIIYNFIIKKIFVLIL